MPKAPRPSQLLICLAAFAMAASALEVAGLWYLKLVEHRFVFVPRDVPLMLPVVHAVVLAAALPALLLVLSRVSSRAGWRLLGTIGGAYVGVATLLVFHPRLHIASVLLLAIGVGIMVGRRFAARQGAVVRSSGVAAVIAAACLTFVVLAGRLGRNAGAPTTPARGDLPNILLIILDTVRGDRLSALGYDRPTTPNLDRLAGDGVLFERAIAPAPWTLPSHASLLTGRWPFDLTADWRTPLDGAHRTLAEVLTDAGYRTAGFVANTRFTSPETGLDRGFSHYQAHTPSAGQFVLASSIGRFLSSKRRLWGILGNEWSLSRRTAADVRTAFERWRTGDESARPFFAFLNFFDAHHPYDPPPAFAGRFGGPKESQSGFERFRQILRPQPAFRTDSVGMEAMRRSYDESIASLDAELGVLFESLKSAGELDRTIVIVSSDHGELFGEHRLVEHGNSLYYPVVNVPLVIRYGNQIPHGLRIKTPVSLRDIPSTILDLAGLDRERLPGVALRAAWDSAAGLGATSPAMAIVTGIPSKSKVQPIARGDMAALVADSLLFIRGGDCQYEVYDVVTDPLNQRNLLQPDNVEQRRQMERLDSLAAFEADSVGRCARLRRNRGQEPLAGGRAR